LQKLQAIRRLDERYINYFSSSSDDCLQPKYLEVLRSDPSEQDRKYLRRYVDVCTPDELKL
jgi:hypothetical protein